ncbi:hypothetical protein BDV11DRAFT_186923 [Aspergillus similis]
MSFPVSPWESRCEDCVCLRARHFSAIRSMLWPYLYLVEVGTGIIRFRLFWGDGASHFFFRLVFPSIPASPRWVVGYWKEWFCGLANLLGLGLLSRRVAAPALAL